MTDSYGRDLFPSDEAAQRIIDAVGIAVSSSTQANPLWRARMCGQLQDALDRMLRACAGRTNPSAHREAFVRLRENAFLAKVRGLLPRDYFVDRAPLLAANRERRAKRFAREFDDVEATDPSWRRPRGRPTEYEIDNLIDSLAWVWMEHYERPCAASYDATRGRSGLSTGPFVAFVRSCSQELAVALADSSFAHPILALLTPEARADLTQALTALTNDPSAVRGRIEKLKRTRERDPSTGQFRARLDGPVAVVREIATGSGSPRPHD